MLSLSVCLSVSHSKGRGAGADGDGWKEGREGKDYFRDDDDDVNNSCHRKGETSSPKLAKEVVKARLRQGSTKRWWGGGKMHCNVFPRKNGETGKLFSSSSALTSPICLIGAALYEKGDKRE